MANDGTGQFWDEARPADNDPSGDGAREIRDLRIGVAARLSKEHEPPSGNTGGFQHRRGSAKAYLQATAPTTRPAGTPALTSGDAGRIWIQSQTGQMYYYNGTQWKAISVPAEGGIPDNSVSTPKIVDSAVTNVKIASGAIDARTLATNSVTGAQIIDGAIQGRHLTDKSIGQNRFADNVRIAGFYALVIEEYGVGTGPGNATSGSWFTRVLNTIKYDHGGTITSVSANKIRLQPGRYRVRGGVPGYNVGRFTSRLQNVTANVTTVGGSVGESTGIIMGWSLLSGEFVISQAADFELQQRVENTAINGLGRATGFQSERFAWLEIELAR